MKKSRIGERPSHLKQRGVMIGLDDERESIPAQPAPPRRPVPPARPRPRRPRAGKPGRMRAVLLGLVIIAAVAAAAFAAGGGIFSIRVERIEMQVGENIVSVAPQETIEAPYGGGLMCRRIVYTGWYRLFPPSSAVFSIEGIEGTDNIFNEDLTALLEPEKRLEYRLVVTGKERQELAAATLRLAMSAAGWIARSERVEDSSAKVLCLEKAIALAPDSEDARVALGRLYEGRGERAKAVREYEAVVKKQPGHAAALRSLINLYEGDRRKTTRLIELCESLARVDGSAADALYYKAAELARSRGRTQQAMSLYRKALQANRGHVPARQQLIKIYEARKEWNRAAGNTVVLLEFEPNNADLRLFLSQMYMNMGKYDSALREAKAAAKLRPGNAAVVLQQGQLAEKANKPAEAVTFYKQALKLDRKNHALCNNLALLLEKQGKRKEAITYYKQAVALSPSSTGYRINLADAYEKNGQIKEAAAAYEALVARDKKNKKAWEALVVLHERTKNPRKALAACQALNGLEPKNILWLQKMAALHEQLGSIAKARDTYKAVLDINPKHAQARQKYVELSKKLVIK